MLNHFVCYLKSLVYARGTRKSGGSDQEFAQTKNSLLISHLIFESMQKLHDTLFFFLDRGTYF
jgi:hypothetical protein